MLIHITTQISSGERRGATPAGKAHVRKRPLGAIPNWDQSC